MKMNYWIRIACTTAVVLLAAVLAYGLWGHYMYSPWTRDGRVRADVVRIAPDVSGLVTRLDVIDNQTVRKGDVLFIIDPIRYRNAVDQATASLDAARAAALAAGASIGAARAAADQGKANYEMLAAQSQRRQNLGEVVAAEDRANAQSAATAAHAGWERARAAQEQAVAEQQRATAAIMQAQVALDAAQINLDRTVVRAPADGYITNLLVRVGDYASAGAPRMALIDLHSYWIYGYFEETKLPRIHVGDSVDVRLLNGDHLQGTVESVARGITDSDSPMASDLLANVNPTFNWVRLAQRLPVRVRIDGEHLPPGVVLAAGMTATLIIHPHTYVAHQNS